MKPLLAVLLLASALAGCATRHHVISATSTIIGVEVAQNPQSQMYQAKLGYNRSELALVPTDKTDTNDGATSTANVIMELRYSGMFSFSESAGIYQRLAVGSDAVKQPGAAFMFAKGPSGTIEPSTANAVSAAIASVPTSNPSVNQRKLRLGAIYKTATNKTDWDVIAETFGYGNFKEFLIEIGTTPEKTEELEQELKKKGVIP